MTRILTALVAVFLWALPAQATEHRPALSISELNELVDSSNFIVQSGCSGTLVGDVKYRLVVTAHHCINDRIKVIEQERVVDGEVKKFKKEVRRDVTVSQKFYEGASQVSASSFQARILGYSDKDQYDLALLQIKRETIPMTKAVPLLPKGEDAMRGQSVYVVGNPAGYDASVTQGIIVSTNREKETKTGRAVKWLQTDAEVFFGNSGGVLMSADGYYLGTVSRGIPGTAVIFAVHYEHLRELLKENCYASLYDSEADSFDVCDEKRRAKKDEKEDESVKGILKDIREKLPPSPPTPGRH